MDSRTGEIHQFENEEELQKARIKNPFLVEIDPDDMTEKQKKELKVSLNDHRSKLGKLRCEMEKVISGTNKRRTSRRKKR